MSVKTTLEQLQAILTEEQFGAFSSSIRELIDTRASELSTSIVEEERATYKAEIMDSANKYIKLAIEQKDFEMTKLLEEAKQAFDDRLVQEVMSIESRVLETVDRVIEEQVNVALPADIREEAAKARIYGSIVERTVGVLEEQAMTIKPDSKITQVVEESNQLKAMVETLNAKISQIETENETVKSDNNRLRVKLFVEHKTAHLPDKEREQVVSMFKGATLSDVKARIDNTIEVLEESRLALARQGVKVTAQDHNITDIHPGVSVKNQGTEKVIEEEKQRNAVSVSPKAPAPEVYEESKDILTTGSDDFFSAIDGFLD